MLSVQTGDQRPNGTDGAPLRTIGVSDATTERRETVAARAPANGELALARQEALEASRLKSRLLADMSHELRTPLNGMIGMTRLLLGTQLDDEQREYAEAVSASGVALMSVVGEILDFSKIEAGGLKLDRHRFALRELVDGVCSMVATTAHEKRLELITWVDEALPDIVNGDSGRIRQVLANLAANAIKFTAAGEVVVRVTAEPVAGSAISVRFEVSDTGIGIRRDALELIFDAFTQAERSTTRQYGGTGLGLAISRELVALMGGAIGVESEPGAGSTFWFTVPLTAAAAGGGAAWQRPNFGGARVLIVDDNPTSRVLLDRQLGAWAMACEVAADPQQAMRLLAEAARSERPYAVVVIDVREPAADGLLLARTIKDAPAVRSAALLLLSCAGSARAAAAAVGIDGFLTKPTGQRRLAREIARLLGPGQLAPAPGGAAPRPVGELAVLVAEDDMVNRLVVVRMLEQRGFHVEAASDGSEAVRMHASGGYDLILMDCQMPELDGCAATEAIRRNDAARALRTPIIAMTADPLQGDRERCLAAGMDDYLGKPLRAADLDAVIARVLATDDDAPARCGPPAAPPGPGAGAGSPPAPARGVAAPFAVDLEARR